MKRALALCFVYRLLAAALMGMPASLSAAAIFGQHPRGDALVVDDAWLLEAARMLRPSAGGLTLQALVLLILASFGWLLPLATLMAVTAGTSFRDGLVRAIDRFPALALLLGLAWLAQVALVIGCIRLARFAANGIESERASDLVAVSGPLAALAIVWVLAVVHDVVRARTIQEGCRVGQALGRAAPALRRFRTWLAAAWRTALGMGAAVGALAGALWLAPRSAFFGAALPILSLAIYVWLRASWFGWLARDRELGPRGVPARGSPVDRGRRL